MPRFSARATGRRFAALTVPGRRGRTWRVLACTVACVPICAMGACSVHTSQSQSSSSESSIAVEQAVAMQVDAAKVTVSQPGSQPQSVLAFSAPTGDDEPEPRTTTVTVGSGLDQHVAEAAAVKATAPDAPSGPVERVTLPLSTQVVQPTDEERDAAASDPAPERAVKIRVADGAPAAGFATRWVQARSGQVQSVTMAAPVDAADKDRSTTEKALMTVLSMPVIFPDQPIGPGATWTVEARVTGESALLQTTSFTLMEAPRDGQVKVQVSVSQRPTIGALDIGAALGDEKAGSLEVLSSSTTGGGVLTVDTAGGVPVSGAVSFVTRVVYGHDGSPTRVVQDAATSLEYHS